MGPHNCDLIIFTGRSVRFFQQLPTSKSIQLTSNQNTMSNQPPPQPTPHQQTFLKIANCSFHIQPYPWQYSMGGFAIKRISNQEQFKFLCIRPKGGGKSPLYQVLVLYVKNVTLCITPILAFGSDQMHKVLKVSDQNLTAFHMDELTDDEVIKLKLHLEILHPNNAVIILASPQFLNNRGRQFLTFLHSNNLICLVVIDELHLSHHFARSFREDFNQICSLVFTKLARNTHCIFMTATCSESILAASQEIFGFCITHKDWPTVKGMANQKQAFQACYYSPVGIRYVYDVISQHLGKKEMDSTGHMLPDKLMFYGNTCDAVIFLM